MTTAAQMGALYRQPSNPILQRLARDIPGYLDELELVDEADAWLRTRRPLPTPPQELEPSVSRRFSDEWFDAKRAYDRAVADQKADRALVMNEKQQAIASASALFTGSLNDLLAALNDELAPLLAELDAVATKLKGAETPSHAIKLGVAPHWARGEDIADDIENLKLAAEELYVHVAPQTYWHTLRPPVGCDDWTSRARIANIQDLWNDPALPRPVNIDGTRADNQPWSSDKLPRLLWFRRHGADLSIRALPQIDAQLRAERDAANPPQEPRPQPGVLNETPRTTGDGYYDRVVTPLEAATPPPVDLDDLTRQEIEA
jgi:hypothetical protein